MPGPGLGPRTRPVEVGGRFAGGGPGSVSGRPKAAVPRPNRTGAPSIGPASLSPIVALLLLTLLIPNEFSFFIGPLRFSPYRLLLVLYIPLALFRFLSGEAGTLRRSDWCALLGCAWIMVSMVVNAGPGGIESGGIMFIETFGAYLVARMSIRTAAQWRQATMVFGIGIAIVAPFAITECLTGKHVIRELTCSMVGRAFRGEIGDRFGLTRAYGPFDHPILQGVVSATVAISAWHAWKGLIAWRTMIWPLCMGGAMSSISSGAMATLAIGTMLSAWSIAAGFLKRKWRTFLILAAIGYFVIDMVSNRSGMAVLLSYFTFSSSTAYGRMIIWEWGFYQNAMKNPVFGLGDRDWVRPGWMVSSSMDNYFLFLMAYYGIPCFLGAAFSIILKVRAAAFATARSAFPHLIMSWWIPMVALSVAGCTVHFWNQALVFFWFFLGAGSWCENEPGADGRSRA
jgi:hypothetical protein